MEASELKCVMVIDESLPSGVIANTAAIIGISLGKRFPEIVGCDVTDASGRVHPGIIEFPVPILKADKELIRSIRTHLYEPAFSELAVVDFSDVAQGCRVYDEFIEKAAATEESQLTYLGIGIYGRKKLVNKLTGFLPLLR